VPINFLDSSCYSFETCSYRGVPSCRQVPMRRLLPSQRISYYSVSLRNRNWLFSSPGLTCTNTCNLPTPPPRSYRLLCQAGRWVRRFYLYRGKLAKDG
jgi:hypothetical protein